MDRLQLLQIIRGEDTSTSANLIRVGLSILEPGYRLGVACRNQSFNLGLRRPTRLARPVISVGNITTGGTGKTPVVIDLAQQLITMGHRPAILLRGYSMPSASHPAPVSDEAQLFSDALGPDVPVQANPDRVAGAAHILDRHPQVTLFLMDDGFQHRQVHRDLDIVLLDATAPFGGLRLLPRGLLREPITSLRRAHAIILTRADLASPERLAAIDRKLQRTGVAGPMAKITHRWDGLLDAHDHVVPTDALRSIPMAGVCGIGNPGAFKAELARHFTQVVGQYELQDHQTYNAQLVQQIDQHARQHKAQALILTEKDWVKWRTVTDGQPPTLPVYRPRLQMAWLEGLDRVQSLLRKHLPPPPSPPQSPAHPVS